MIIYSEIQRKCGDTKSRENKTEIEVTLGHVKDLCFDLTGSKEIIKGIKSRCDTVLCAF